MEKFVDQFRQVFRRLARAPLFTAITLLTLAISIGANIVVFSVVNGVLLKPLSYPHSEQLVGIWYNSPRIGIPKVSSTPSFYFINREQSTTIQDIGVFFYDSVSVTGIGQPEQVQTLGVTDGALPLL